MNDVLSFLARAAGLLSFLETTGVVKTNAGTQISVVLADIQAVIKGAHPTNDPMNPSPDLVATVVKLLADLKADNVLTGSVVDQLAADGAKYHQWVTEAQQGQTIVLKMGDFAGVPGAYLFSPVPSDQYKSLGL